MKNLVSIWVALAILFAKVRVSRCEQDTPQVIDSYDSNSEATTIDWDNSAAFTEGTRQLGKGSKKAKTRHDSLKKEISLLQQNNRNLRDENSALQEEINELKNRCIDDLDPDDTKVPSSTPVSFLMVQIAQNCELRRLDDGSTELVADVGSDTLAFADRPDRQQFLTSTDGFVKNFDRLFKDDLPNAAITLVSDEDDQFEGPIVVILSNPKELTDGDGDGDGTVRISYSINQSSEQAEVVRLAQFFQKSDTVEFTDCSLFIDNVTTGQSCGVFTFCGDNLSCFTDGNSDYCVPNGKKGACCGSFGEAAGIDCLSGLSCCEGESKSTAVGTCYTTEECDSSNIVYAKKGSCNVNTGEPATAFVKVIRTLLP